MKTQTVSEDLFEKAQKALLIIIHARTRKKLPVKKLRAVNENIRLEYLLALINQAELWLDYRAQLKTILSFNDADLFNGTLNEHCRAVIKACETVTPALQARKNPKKSSGPVEHGDPVGISMAEAALP